MAEVRSALAYASSMEEEPDSLLAIAERMSEFDDDDAGWALEATQEEHSAVAHNEEPPTPWRDDPNWSNRSREEQFAAYDTYVEANIKKHLAYIETNHLWADPEKMGYLGHDPERDAIVEELAAVQLHGFLAANGGNITACGPQPDFDHEADGEKWTEWYVSQRVGELAAYPAEGEHDCGDYWFADRSRDIAAKIGLEFMQQRGWSTSMNDVRKRMDNLTKRMIDYGEKMLQEAQADLTQKQQTQIGDLHHAHAELKEVCDSFVEHWLAKLNAMGDDAMLGDDDRAEVAEQLGLYQAALEHIQSEINGIINPDIFGVLSKRRELSDTESTNNLVAKLRFGSGDLTYEHTIVDRISDGALMMFPKAWVEDLAKDVIHSTPTKGSSYCGHTDVVEVPLGGTTPGLRSIERFIPQNSVINFDPTMLKGGDIVAHEFMHKMQTCRPMVTELEQSFARTAITKAQMVTNYVGHAVNTDLFVKQGQYAGQIYTFELKGTTPEDLDSFIYAHHKAGTEVTFGDWQREIDAANETNVVDYGLREIASCAAQDIYMVASESNIKYPEDELQGSNELRSWYMAMLAIV